MPVLTAVGLLEPNPSDKVHLVLTYPVKDTEVRKYVGPDGISNFPFTYSRKHLW